MAQAAAERAGRSRGRHVRGRRGLLDSLHSQPEDRPIDLDAFITANPGLVVGLLVLLLVLALLGLALTARRTARLEARLAGLTRGAEGDSLESVLQAHLATVGRLADEVGALAGRTAGLEAEARRSFRRIGLVRFNPFEDTGGNQSFALALLDSDDDGVVVSSLHARGVTRIYAKALSRGRPEATLSDEEAEAVSLARSASLGRVALADRVAAGGRAGRDRGGDRSGA